MIIPVVFAINNSYVKQLSTVIYSILNNSSSNFNFFVLTSYISDDNKKILQAFVDSMSSGGSKISFINVKDEVKSKNLDLYLSKRDGYDYISTETYYRFFISSLIHNYEKVIYLDSDIIVSSDLSELYLEDIKNFYVAAVEDYQLNFLYNNHIIKTNTQPNLTFKEYFEFCLKKNDHRYFNAGVLLLNLTLIYKEKLQEKLLNFVERNSPLEYQDQDALNSVFDGKVKFISNKWNVLKDTNVFIENLKSNNQKQQLKQAYDNPSVIHYVGSNKPWIIHNDNYGYLYLEKWWKNYKKTPYYRKEDNVILEYALRCHKRQVFRCFINISFYKFCFIKIYQNRGKLYFIFFNKIKSRLKYKKEKYLFKKNSI